MITQIRFVRLGKSEMIKEAIEDKVEPILDKFNLDDQSKAYIDVEMENSPHQAGRDVFKVKLFFKEGSMEGFVLEKSDINFYKALSQLTSTLATNIDRFKGKKLRA